MQTVTMRASSSNPMYLFIFAANTEPAISRWKNSLIAACGDMADNRFLRSLSHELTRLFRTCSVRAFAIGSTISTGLELSKPVMINPKTSPKLCLIFAGQGPQHIFTVKTLFSIYSTFSDSIIRSDNILVGKYEKESFLKQSGLFVPREQANLPEDGVWAVQDTVYSIVFAQLAHVDLLQRLRALESNTTMSSVIGENSFLRTLRTSPFTHSSFQVWVKWPWVMRLAIIVERLQLALLLLVRRR
jgi:hypothetical protein